VRFVTAHGVGIKAQVHGEHRNVVLIPKNTRVPCDATRRFRTNEVIQRLGHIPVEITQGNTENLQLAERLGRGVIALPPGEPPGKLVEVTMSFDQQGRLHTRAVYLETGHAMQMTVAIEGGLREDEVQAFREFMEQTGFTPPRPFDPRQGFQLLPDDDENGDEGDLPMITPI
jgi:molecular chaperone DnaK (HSP70)